MLKTRLLLSQVDWFGVHTLTQQVSLWLTLYIEGGGVTAERSRRSQHSQKPDYK